MVEDSFGLRDLISLTRDPEEVGYKGMSARTPELISRFLQQLAAWTKEFGLPLLTNGDAIFDQLSEASLHSAVAEAHAQRAALLRPRADDAWRRRDFASVINAYSEIISELSTIELQRSELGRLHYAQRAMGESD